MGSTVEVIPPEDGAESTANIVELEFRSVMIGKRRLTITMWEQIFEVPLLVNSGELNFTPLARVNKCKCPKTEDAHVHVLGTVGGNPCRAKMFLNPTDNYMKCHWEVISVAKRVAILTAISDMCKTTSYLWEEAPEIPSQEYLDYYAKTENGWITKDRSLCSDWMGNLIGVSRSDHLIELPRMEFSFMLRGKRIKAFGRDWQSAVAHISGKHKRSDGKRDDWIRYDQVDDLRRMCETEISLKDAWTQMLETTGNIHRSLATIDALPQILVGG